MSFQFEIEGVPTSFVGAGTQTWTMTLPDDWQPGEIFGVGLEYATKDAGLTTFSGALYWIPEGGTARYGITAEGGSTIPQFDLTNPPDGHGNFFIPYGGRGGKLQMEVTTAGGAGTATGVRVRLWTNAAQSLDDYIDEGWA